MTALTEGVGKRFPLLPSVYRGVFVTNSLFNPQSLVTPLNGVTSDCRVKKRVSHKYAPDISPEVWPLLIKTRTKATWFCFPIRPFNSVSPPVRLQHCLTHSGQLERTFRTYWRSVQENVYLHECYVWNQPCGNALVQEFLCTHDVGLKNIQWNLKLKKYILQ